jgi:hypothetical protein
MHPGFARKPGVVGLANRTAGAREKYRAGPKALAIDLNAGRDCAAALRALDHDHSHANSSLNAFSWKIKPAGWIAPLVGAWLLGGITHLPFCRALGGLHARGGTFSNRPVTLRAAF